MADEQQLNPLQAYHARLEEERAERAAERAEQDAFMQRVQKRRDLLAHNHFAHTRLDALSDNFQAQQPDNFSGNLQAQQEDEAPQRPTFTDIYKANQQARQAQPKQKSDISHYTGAFGGLKLPPTSPLLQEAKRQMINPDK